MFPKFEPLQSLMAVLIQHFKFMFFLIFELCTYIIRPVITLLYCKNVLDRASLRQKTSKPLKHVWQTLPQWATRLDIYLSWWDIWCRELVVVVIVLLLSLLLNDVMLWRSFYVRKLNYVVLRWSNNLFMFIHFNQFVTILTMLVHIIAKKINFHKNVLDMSLSTRTYTR